MHQQGSNPSATESTPDSQTHKATVPSQIDGGSGERSPILPPIPKRSESFPLFQPLGPLVMSSPDALPSGLQPDAIGEDHRRAAIAELQETLQKDFESTIFDEADLEEPVAADMASPSDSDVSSLGVEDFEDSIDSRPEVELGVRRRRRRKRKSSKRFSLSWSIVWLMITACFSGVGVFAFRWMTSLPPTPDCQSLSAMSADVERLHCAHLAAKSGTVESLLAGFDLVRPWTSDHPLFWKAQSMMERWTKDILAIAESTLYAQGLDEAVVLVEAVPPTSPLADQAQATLNEWNGLWSQGEAIVETALDAVQADQWDVAAQQVVELGKIEHDYWRQERANELSLRILAERQGEQVYEDVKAIADTDNPDELAVAIAQLDELEPNTFVWRAAQADMTQWSQSLADSSLERFRAGDIEGALSLIQALPAHSDLVPGASDLVRFGYAQRQATDDAENWTPGLNPVVGFMTALSAAEDIPSDSPFYDQAQIQMVQWRRQLRDVTQLQLAQAIAATGHRWFFDVAIDQASMVEKGQPRRLQAQTLLAHWRQEVERVEDRPQLALAHRLAEAGTIEALGQAIAQAETIDPQRALRQDADKSIAQWTGDIQTIEDQPILDSALALADSGNLSQAISEASQIGQDRALYGQAQEKIGEWQTTLAIARNQQLLARARSLAGQTRLTEAINVASGVSAATPGLYREARAAMSQWRAQRDRIWAARTPSPSPSRVVRSSPSPSPRPAPRPAPTPTPSRSFDGFYGPSYDN